MTLDGASTLGPLAGHEIAGDREVEAGEAVEAKERSDGLRPASFDRFIGQAAVRDNLDVAIRAARRRKEALDHLLLCGLPGLGKTTLAYLVARAMGTDLRETSGPVLDRPGDLAGILTNLKRGDVLFIDEIHRLSPVVEEYLYSAMEDFAIDIVIDQGPAARSVRIALQPFTLVGATTREGRLTAPFRARFGLVERLEPYPVADLERIVMQSAGALDVPIEPGAATRLAAMSRGTPRVANRLLRRARDLAELSAEGVITDAIAHEQLDRLKIDASGLGALDRRILETLLRAGGLPVGLKTIAVSVGESEETIEDVHEPFLIREGYLLKTPRGRAATPRAHEALGRSPPATPSTG